MMKNLAIIYVFVISGPDSSDIFRCTNGFFRTELLLNLIKILIALTYDTKSSKS